MKKKQLLVNNKVYFRFKIFFTLDPCIKYKDSRFKTERKVIFDKIGHNTDNHFLFYYDGA